MPAIQKVHYTHDAMIDLIIADPCISQGEIAAHFGYTQAWISTVFSSDAFKQRLAARKAELVDPYLIKSIEERLEAVARRSIDVVLEKLDANPTAQFALQAMEKSAKALGYGAKDHGPSVVQNFVAVVPAKAGSAEEWLRGRACLPVAAAEAEPLVAAPLEGEAIERKVG